MFAIPPISADSAAACSPGHAGGDRDGVGGFGRAEAAWVLDGARGGAGSDRRSDGCSPSVEYRCCCWRYCRVPLSIAELLRARDVQAALCGRCTTAHGSPSWTV